MFETITQGIRICVQTEYVPAQSDPERQQFLFAYHITIHNESDESVKLLSRYWQITDGSGEVEEVEGDGVVGLQPTIHPGEHFSYTSACPLRTQVGTMQGHYWMQGEAGVPFKAHINVFRLALPGSLH